MIGYYGDTIKVSGYKIFPHRVGYKDNSKHEEEVFFYFSIRAQRSRIVLLSVYNPNAQEDLLLLKYKMREVPLSISRILYSSL